MTLVTGKSASGSVGCAYNLLEVTLQWRSTIMAAIEILGLEKTYMVGFWRKRPEARAATASSDGGRRRDLRLSRT